MTQLQLSLLDATEALEDAVQRVKTRRAEPRPRLRAMVRFRDVAEVTVPRTWRGEEISSPLLDSDD